MKKYGKDHSRGITTDSDRHLSERQRRAQPQQTSSLNFEPSTTHESYYNRKKKHNLSDRSKAESCKDKVTTFSDSEKQQSSRKPQFGQKDDDDIKQSNQLIGTAIHSDTTSMEGGDDDNKDNNDN